MVTPQEWEHCRDGNTAGMVDTQRDDYTAGMGTLQGWEHHRDGWYAGMVTPQGW